MFKYSYKKIEVKWQKRWAEAKINQADDNSDKEKKYILDMFPYPSGAGLHVGHVESYTATDIYSRYLRMRGYNVLHPQGWDAFGLPAENYAVKTGVHPAKTTKDAMATFKKQINSLGFSYDWSREVNSSAPDYYKWTQWLFLLFYKNGLAYKKKAKVNWCPGCQTVLANEQAEGGKCERCGSEVLQKELEQWFFRITDFIEDQTVNGRLIKGLISGLEDIDWPESTKQSQLNWIGRSPGALVKFKIKNKQGKEIDELEVFTTRPDTLCGCTYMVVAPEHKLVAAHQSLIANYQEVEKYIKETKHKSELERTMNKEKSGVRLKGLTAANPVNKKEIPIFVADYVLAGYGAGAIMAVPAHDERDFEFAKKYKLPIKEVIIPQTQNHDLKLKTLEAAYTEEGVLVNSENYNGLTSAQAREEIIKRLEENDLGKKEINYKIRDWLISRQRYWGAPIPIIYCDYCGEVPAPEEDLPVKLPADVDFKPTGESPLVYSKEFQEVKCPQCGAKARREADTMDTFVCSSWYYLRYADPRNKKEFASRELLKKWLPVDVYVGGAEHTVLHLLYSRFFAKALEKLGYLEFNEPFLKLRHQGIILAEDGNKMSKSKGNVINPDEVVAEYGADSLRLYEMFMGPLEDAKPWNTKGIIGVKRFLEKVWKQREKAAEKEKIAGDKLQKFLHKTIKKVSEDIESFKFNTAVSALMILINEMEKEKVLRAEDFSLFLKILSPFAPHLAEELWESLGNKESIFKESWPKFDPKLVKEEEINLIVQINGRLRDSLRVAADIGEEEAGKLALGSEKIKKWIAGKKILKIIFVKGKLVNIVIK